MEEGCAFKQSSHQKDPAWKYNNLKDPKDPILVMCIFSEKTTKGGIFRAKQSNRYSRRDNNEVF